MKPHIVARVGSIIVGLLFFTSAQAIQITTNTAPDELIDALIIPNSGITVTEGYIDYGVFPGDGEFPTDVLTAFSLDSGEPAPPSQSGIFTNASGTYGLPSEGGIVFSTGDVQNYEDGPNTSNGTTSEFGTTASEAQNDRLSELTGQSTHFDPIELGFTFDVSEDVKTLSFIAAFGSEEFPEYVGGSVTDGFGLYINGVNVAGAQLSGAGPNDPLLPINIDHPDFLPISGTELDGLLAPNNIPLLRFDVPVEPGSTGNTLEFLLADASDSLVDTTIFLSSFGNFDVESGESEFTPILPDANNPTNDEGEFVFELPEIIDIGETIWFDPDIATGYFYSTDGLFASVTAPSLASVPDPNGYQLTYNDGITDIIIALAAGETYVFTAPVSEFTLEDIDVSLMLDPTDATAFVTGVSFEQPGTFITQSPITTFVNDPTDIPEPPLFFAFLMFAVLSLLHKRK